MSEKYFLALNCTEEPFKPEVGLTGKYNFKGNKTYTANVTYSCPVEGWGFPSTGEFNMTSVCQANAKWSIDFVEDCQRKIKFK